MVRAVHHRRGSARDTCSTRGALGALDTFGGRSNAPHEPQSSTRDVTPITIAMRLERRVSLMIFGLNLI